MTSGSPRSTGGDTSSTACPEPATCDSLAAGLRQVQGDLDAFHLTRAFGKLVDTLLDAARRGETLTDADALALSKIRRTAMDAWPRSVFDAH